MTGPYRLRKAEAADLPALRALHRAAFDGLAREHYTTEQIEGFLADVVTADPDLVGDGTYYVVEHEGAIVASGGWTMRRPSYVRADEVPSGPTPACATIRALFTDPSHARRGLARRIMDLSEEQAVVQGMAERIELCATVNGLPLYLRLGYQVTGARTLPLSNGTRFTAIAMAKTAWPPAEIWKTAPVIPAFRVSACSGRATDAPCDLTRQPPGPSRADPTRRTGT